jgi:hypothetical protein
MTESLQAQASYGVPGILRINADPVDWPQLPNPVKDKLRSLRRERDDARSLWRAASDEREKILEIKRVAESRLMMLTGGREDSKWYRHSQAASFGNLLDDHPEVTATLARLEESTARLGQQNPIVDARSHQFHERGRLVESLERFLERLGNRETTLFKGSSPPRRQKGESLAEGVERCRRRIRELDADQHRIRSAPWPSAEAKQRARAEIEKLAERGQPNVLSLIESPNGSIGWAERKFNDIRLGDRMLTAVGDPSALALLIWLHRDTLIERIEQEIDLVADDQHALTSAQRVELLKPIERDRLAAERAEDVLVGAAIEEGATILRRCDADPRAVLGLDDGMPLPRT